jgi:archaellum biogenesis ATPase FlaH
METIRQGKTIYLTVNNQEIDVYVMLSFEFIEDWELNYEIVEATDENGDRVSISKEIEDEIDQYIDNKTETYINHYCKGF